MRIIIGPPAKGEDFWDRAEELDKIWSAIETNSILLTAPRRFGKTSIMQRMENQPKTGWDVLYFDVEKFSNPQEFIAEIGTIFLQRKKLANSIKLVKEFFGKSAHRIELGYAEFKLSFKQVLEEDWQKKGEQLFNYFQHVSKKTIIIIDELPMMMDAMQKKSGNGDTRDFLGWLRSMRQMPALQEKIRWVTGGSIGIDKVLLRIGCGVKAINDLERISIRELSPISARGFAKALLSSELSSVEIHDTAVEEILEIIGVPIPYFIQVLVRECVNEMKRTKTSTLSQEVIRVAYKCVLEASQSYFRYYYDRLESYYEPMVERVAKAILTEVARNEQVSCDDLRKLFELHISGKADFSAFSDMLTELENDFYLTTRDSGKSFSFATKVLRDWWLRYHAR